MADTKTELIGGMGEKTPRTERGRRTLRKLLDASHQDIKNLPHFPS